MMNIDNSSIENTQNTQSDDVAAAEAADAEQFTETGHGYSGSEELAEELEAEAQAIAAGDQSEDQAVANLMTAIDSGTEDLGEDPDAQALMADSGEPVEVEGDGVTATDEDEKKAKATKAKEPAAYEAFVAALKAHAQALGLDVIEQSSFFQFRAGSGHKLYIEKALKKGVSRIDTSLPRSALVVNGKDISLPLSKPNGKIECHVDPSIESVKQALEVLASYEDKIRAPKKAAPKAAAV